MLCVMDVLSEKQAQWALRSRLLLHMLLASLCWNKNITCHASEKHCA